MFFKKYKIQQTPKSSKTVPYGLWILGVIVIFFIGIKAIDAINAIEFDLAEVAPSYLAPLTGTWVTETEQFEDHVNILLLGRWGWNHDAPDLTDTIILASIGKTAISLLSIPRDLYVSYPDSNKTGKINRIYETYKPIDPQEAIEKVKKKVTEITGQEIDYYVNVDFEGFVEIVDILWWVDVSIQENFIDYQYPTSNGWYTTFILRKWDWTLDGDVALKYARSRHSTSDFDRSLRQQEILSSLKNKALSLGYFRDSIKIRDLYSAIKKYVETDIDISTLLKLALEFKASQDKELLSFNLNDTCYTGSPICSKWGFLYVPLREIFGGQSVVLIDGSDVSSLSNYTLLETYMSLIFEQREVFALPTPLSIYNATSTPWLAWSLSNTFKKYGILSPEDDWIGNIREKKFEKSILYYNGIDEENATLKFLQESLGFEVEETPEPLYSEEGIRIEIVLWEDFEPIEYLNINAL